jgi:hypothetical protein
MIFNNRLGATIITIYEAFRVFELSGHWLAFDRAIQISEGRLHVRYSLAANWTAE